MTDIGKEYGAALFMLACEENAKKEYGAALENVRKIFSESPEYPQLLSSPSIPLGERLEVIATAFGDKVPRHVLSYLQLLCEKGRISYLQSSVDEYLALLDASERVLNASVTSAVELTDSEKQKLESKLSSIYKGQINAEYRVDEALLGGLVVEIDGKIMDGSLRGRLRDVKEVIGI